MEHGLTAVSMRYSFSLQFGVSEIVPVHLRCRGQEAGITHGSGIRVRLEDSNFNCRVQKMEIRFYGFIPQSREIRKAEVFHCRCGSCYSVILLLRSCSM